MSAKQGKVRPVIHAPRFVSLRAVQHVRGMRGGCQSHLLRASDGNNYIVKFTNNPQGTRILANELLAAGLGGVLQLPMPPAAIVEVSTDLINHSPGLVIETPTKRVQCNAGIHFGSRSMAEDGTGNCFDYLPEQLLGRLKNRNDFLGALVFDVWTSNADYRQAIFCREKTKHLYKSFFIDNGYCFKGITSDSPGHIPQPTGGVSLKIYESVRGWDSFEPWLSRIERFDANAIWQCARAIPPEWYEHCARDLELLVVSLLRRRQLLAQLLEQVLTKHHGLFPNWNTQRSPSFCLPNEFLPRGLNSGSALRRRGNSRVCCSATLSRLKSTTIYFRRAVFPSPASPPAHDSLASRHPLPSRRRSCA